MAQAKDQPEWDLSAKESVQHLEGQVFVYEHADQRSSSYVERTAEGRPRGLLSVDDLTPAELAAIAKHKAGGKLPEPKAEPKPAAGIKSTSVNIFDAFRSLVMLAKRVDNHPAAEPVKDFLELYHKVRHDVSMTLSHNLVFTVDSRGGISLDFRDDDDDRVDYDEVSLVVNSRGGIKVNRMRHRDELIDTRTLNF